MLLNSPTMSSFVRRSVWLSCVLLWMCFVSSTSAADTIHKELFARIEALEIQGREQAKTLMIQAEKIEHMESKLETQNVKLASQEQTIEHYKQKVAEMERKVEDISANSNVDRKETQETKENDAAGQIKHIVSGVNTDIAKVNIRKRLLVMGDETPVAFHAVVKAHKEVSHIGLGQKIVFPDVMLNLGAGYHNQHGLFIAPRSGLYLFSTSILSYNTGHVEIFVHLMKNGNVLANAYAHGDAGRHDQGSVTVVTQLDVGDEVWVSLYGPSADDSFWGESFDSFMGILLIPM